MNYLKANLDDVETVYNIVRASIKSVYPKYYPEEAVIFFLEHCSREKIMDDIKNNSVGILYDSEIPVGTGCSAGDNITMVYVHPEHQRKGFGTYIVRQLENEISKKYRTVKLDASIPSGHLLDNLGYKTVEHCRTECADNVFLIHEVMEKNLIRRNAIRLETERLVLRSLEKSDAPKLFELLANPRVNCYESERVASIQEVNDYIDNSDSEYEFAVCTKDNKFLGLLFGCVEEEDTFSPCWNFLQEACGKGYCTEAVRAYFEYLFNTKNLRRLYAYTEDDNIASQKVCRKLGMRQEGLFKEFISFVNNADGTPKYENTLQFAILRHEWNGLKYL